MHGSLLVYAASGVVAPLSDAVELIYEDDTWSVASCFVEEHLEFSGAHAHQRTLEIRSLCGDEIHIGLVCQGLGKIGLAVSRRTFENHALDGSDLESRPEESRYPRLHCGRFAPST